MSVVIGRVEKIWKSIKTLDIREEEKDIALKVLLILDKEHSQHKYSNRNWDYLHSINESISLLLDNEEYDEWQDAWERISE
jgi:hypothetical protein